MKKYLSICIQCGKEFEIKGNYKRKYCSKECARKAVTSKIICKECGKEFEIESWKNMQFCSYNCYDVNRKKCIQKKQEALCEGGINICAKCGKTLDISKFQIRYGKISDYCKECKAKIDQEYYKNNKGAVKQKTKEYRENNREKVKEYQNKYQKDNKDSIQERHKEYKEKHIEEITKYQKDYKESNKDKLKIFQKEYRESNLEKIKECRKEYYKNNRKEIRANQKEYRENNRGTILERARERRYNNIEEVRAHQNEYNKNNRDVINKRQRERYQIPKYRLSRNVSRRLYDSLKGNKNDRHWESIVGFNLDSLLNHLESKFDDKMSWNNYGKYWSLDHRRPISSFSFNSYEDFQFKECWALENLQPLEARENIRKGGKMPEEYYGVNN